MTATASPFTVAQATPQLDLFAAPVYAEDAPDDPHGTPSVQAPHPALERLKGIDPNELRPRDALDLLYELHQLANAEDKHAQQGYER